MAEQNPTGAAAIASRGLVPEPPVMPSLARFPDGAHFRIEIPSVDTGLLHLVSGMQAAGQLPASIVWKVSAVLAPSNPLSFRQLEELGGSTINVPSDLTLGQLAECGRPASCRSTCTSKRPTPWAAWCAATRRPS